MKISNKKRLACEERGKEHSECSHTGKNERDSVNSTRMSLLASFTGFWSNLPSVKSPFLIRLCVKISPMDANDVLVYRISEKLRMILILTILTICVGDSLECYIFMFSSIVRIPDGRRRSTSPILMILATIRKPGFRI